MEKAKINDMIHRIKGLFLTLGCFLDCMDNDLKSTTATIQPNEIREYCSIVIAALHEIEDLILDIEHETN
jgi:hypothetical protein